MIHPAPDGGQALHENDGRGTVMVPASGPAGYRRSPRACRGDGAGRTAASKLARHAGNPGHSPVRHEEFGGIATAAEQAWRAGRRDKDLRPAGHTVRPAPAHPMRAGAFGSDESAYLALRHRVPDRDVTGRARAMPMRPWPRTTLPGDVVTGGLGSPSAEPGVAVIGGKDVSASACRERRFLAARPRPPGTCAPMSMCRCSGVQTRIRE